MTVPLEFLRKIPYFQRLPEAQLQQIRPLVREENYARGELVIIEGDECEAIYFVKSGRVKVYKTSPEGKEQILRIMTEGDTFNEVPVFDGGDNPASVEALQAVSLYLLPVEDMRSLMLGVPIISENVIRILASRLRHLVGLVEDLSFRHVTGRVAKILLQHGREATQGGGRLTQQEMATMAGTAREMVGRALKGLEQSGAIKVERGRIVIVDRDALERIS